MRCLCAFDEVTDLHKLCNTLEYIGYTGLDPVRAVVPPNTFKLTKCPIMCNDDSISNAVYFYAGDWDLNVCCESIPGFITLHNNHVRRERLVECHSVREIVRPSMFYDFAGGLISNLLRQCNAILYDKPDIRTYLYQLLCALDTVPQIKIPYETTWDDCANTAHERTGQVKATLRAV